MASRCKLQISREADVRDRWGPLTIRLGDHDVFDLEAGQLKAVFHDAGEVTITVGYAGGPVLSRTILLPEDHILLLSLHEVRPKWWDRVLAKPPSFTLSEVSRAYLAPYDPGPVRMLAQQTWIGHATSEELLRSIMAERDEYYSDENIEKEGTPEHLALSSFAEAMNQRRYDHDFLEYGFAKQGDDLETRFKGHSWVNEWAPVMRTKLSVDELKSVNAYVMFVVDRTEKFGDQRQIREPRDLKLAGIHLRYIGELEHPSHS